MSDEKIPLPMYGVWIPNQGWVRGSGAKAFADMNISVAKELAKRIGNKAQVFYVDEALVDLEQQLLDAEKENKFALNFFTFFYKRLSKATRK